MSSALIQNFFPSIAKLIRSHPLAHRVWLKLFPPSIEKLCPRPQISLQLSEEKWLTVWWPYASIFCVVGIILGVSHAVVLLQTAFTNRARRGSFIWGFAFLWYGTMSVGGLFYHCLSTNSVFYFLDVVSTACCSISIAAGCTVFTSRDDRDSGWRRSVALCYVVVAILALQGPQIVRDLLYLVPAVAALVVGIWFVWRSWKRRSSRARGWLWWAILGATMSLSGVVMDAWLCTNLGSNWSCLLWFFLGSDIAICCLYQSASISATERQVTPQHSGIKQKKY